MDEDQYIQYQQKVDEIKKIQNENIDEEVYIYSCNDCKRNCVIEIPAYYDENPFKYPIICPFTNKLVDWIFIDISYSRNHIMTKLGKTLDQLRKYCKHELSKWHSDCTAHKHLICEYCGLTLKSKLCLGGLKNDKKSLL